MFILKRIFKKWDGELLTGLIWLRIKAGGGSCEYCEEHSCSTKVVSFLNRGETISFSTMTMLDAVSYTFLLSVKVKVKQSRYRPGVAQRVPRR